MGVQIISHSSTSAASELSVTLTPGTTNPRQLRVENPRYGDVTKQHEQVSTMISSNIMTRFFSNKNHSKDKIVSFLSVSKTV